MIDLFQRFQVKHDRVPPYQPLDQFLPQQRRKTPSLPSRNRTNAVTGGRWAGRVSQRLQLDAFSTCLNPHSAYMAQINPNPGHSATCVCVCQPLFRRVFSANGSSQGHTASMTYRVQRSCGHGWEGKADHLAVPAFNTLTPMVRPAAVRCFHGPSSCYCPSNLFPSAACSRRGFCSTPPQSRDKLFCYICGLSTLPFHHHFPGN